MTTRLLDYQVLNDIRQVAEGLHGARAVVGDRDLEVLFDGEEDRERVEGVDAGVGEKGFGSEFVRRYILFFLNDFNQGAFDVGAGHPVVIIRRVRKRGWLLYPMWMVVCAVLFLALRGAEDPSRRRDRILSNQAGVRALQVLQEKAPDRFNKYEVVHVAWADSRWIVLCDAVPRTALREAVVVELDGRSGKLLTIRRPVRTSRLN